MSASRAKRAAQRETQSVIRLVEHFPFAAQIDQIAWLAALLTVHLRPLTLPAPLFLLVGSAGTGKTLLCNLISEITAGMPAPRVSQCSSERDQSRQVLQVTKDRLHMVVIDNAQRPLGNGSLDAAITATDWQERSIGNSNIKRLNTTAVWFATSTQVKFRSGAKTPRGTILLRLMSEVGETRSNLHHDAHIGDGVLREVRASLNDVYALYDRLDHGDLPALNTPGSPFVGWDLEVRRLLTWLDFPDPWEASIVVRKQYSDERYSTAPKVADAR